MTYAALLLFSVVLFELFALLGIGKDATAIITRSQEAMRVLQSPEIGDDEKETHMRRGSAEIFKATLRFTAKFLFIGSVLYLLFVFIVAIRPDLEASILENLLSPVVIVLLTVVTMCYAWARKNILARW